MSPLISRGFGGRRRRDVDPSRVPPGQYVVDDFPVLSAGPTPSVSLDQWTFSITGAVDETASWSWEEFLAPIVITGWLPGYPDPEYYLRLLLHSESKTNEGGYAYAPFDELVERARQERRDRERLELYHAADRMAVVEQAALIPLAYGRSTAIVKPYVRGWWEFGKTSAGFADLVVDER